MQRSASQPEPRANQANNDRIVATTEQPSSQTTNQHGQEISAGTRAVMFVAQPDSIGGPRGASPFVNGEMKSGPASFPVIRIKNIPYDVTRQEVTQFLGHASEPIDYHLEGCPIHIIMERPTSKTMDCFIEIKTMEAAKAQANRHQALIDAGRPPKLGSRYVFMDLVTQDVLLANLFPRAKAITWERAIPQVIQNQDEYSGGFNGFFTKEEMIGLIRHAQYPSRSPFSGNCLQRVYECMISTLYKFPWYMGSMYTLADRKLLVETYMTMLIVLVEKVERTNTKGLDQNLLRDYLFSGMNCPGFGERQKFELIARGGRVATGIRVQDLAVRWPFDLLLRREGSRDDSVMFFLDLIEYGITACGVDNVIDGVKDFYKVVPHEDPDTSDIPPFLNRTRFYFSEAVQVLDYAGAIQLEANVAELLLQKGWDQYKAQYGHQQQQPPDDGGDGYTLLEANMDLLRIQQEEFEAGVYYEDSPSVSPRTTSAAPVGASNQLTPTAQAFAPRLQLTATARSFIPRGPLTPIPESPASSGNLSEPRKNVGVIGGEAATISAQRRGSDSQLSGTVLNNSSVGDNTVPDGWSIPFSPKKSMKVSETITEESEGDEGVALAGNEEAAKVEGKFE